MLGPMAASPPDLIDDELRSFMQGPVSAILASVDQTNVPDATRISGLVDLSSRRLRILISTEAREARVNAEPGARVAVLVTDITNYRSIQLKGRVLTGPQERTAGDAALVHHHVESFCKAAPQVGLDPELAVALFPLEVVALVLEVDELYNQTPGPGAGRRIAVGR
jgi:hypothetical protein